MTPKRERANEIARAAISAKLPFIRSYASAHCDQRKRIELTFRNGARLTLEFLELASVLALVEGAPQAPDGWNTITVRFGGQTKLHLRCCGAQVELISYVPGPWERFFGVDDGGDTEILLPPTLR